MTPPVGFAKQGSVCREEHRMLSFARNVPARSTRFPVMPPSVHCQAEHVFDDVTVLNIGDGVLDHNSDA